jgi:hypothetical protein
MHTPGGRRAARRGAHHCRVACATPAHPFSRPRAVAPASGRGACTRKDRTFAGLAPAPKTSQVPTPRPVVTAAMPEHPTEQAGELTRAVSAP